LSVPSVAPGSSIIDIGQILRLEPRELERLKEKAVESSAILVTSPTVVSIETAWGPLLMAIGPGSLIFEEPLDDTAGSARVYRLRSREWVDGCRVGRLVDPIHPGGALEEVEGTLLALGYRDPIALALSGARARLQLETAYYEGEAPLLTIGNRSVLGYSRDAGRYIVRVSGGRLRVLLDTLASLKAGCGGLARGRWSSQPLRGLGVG
jgi:hypothetical protein